ncbi:GGDEF domain-containing protein [Roseateles sp. GG27B]
MPLDHATLFNLLLLQTLAAAAVLLAVIGRHGSRAARWAQAGLGLAALGGLALAGSGKVGGELVGDQALTDGTLRLLQSLAMLAFSASLSVLWAALNRWLSPRPGRPLMWLAPLLMPVVYAWQFDDPAFRASWALGWLALQLIMIVLLLSLPKPTGELDLAVRLAHHKALPGPDHRRWRALLLTAVLPLALLCLLRASDAVFTDLLEQPFLTAHFDTALGLACQWALLLTLPALLLAWRGETEAELARLAQTDGLTGLSDRRAFAARSVDMLSMARRHREPLALMVLDVDHLKAINTEHGQEAGDRALALFGSCLTAQMRLGDLAGRVGGDEFAVLMARCEAQGPQALDKRMRDALALRAQAELGFKLDFSGGWAKLRHGDRNIDDLMRRAETAIYEAKHGGCGRLQSEPGLET